MLSTNPPDPYSIAKSLIFIVTVNPKLDHPPRLTELGVRGGLFVFHAVADTETTK